MSADKEEEEEEKEEEEEALHQPTAAYGWGMEPRYSASSCHRVGQMLKKKIP